MLRAVRLPFRLTAEFMTYPFGAAKTELEKAFALPSVQTACDVERAGEPPAFDDTDRAVALFEHPDH